MSNQKDELREVKNDEEMSDIVELIDDEGKKLKFRHVGTIDYKDEWYCFFQPAEENANVSEDEVAIFKITGEEGDEVLSPIEDEKLLNEVFDEFCRIMEEEDDDCDCDECHDGCDCGCDHTKKN